MLFFKGEVPTKHIREHVFQFCCRYDGIHVPRPLHFSVCKQFLQIILCLKNFDTVVVIFKYRNAFYSGGILPLFTTTFEIVLIFFKYTERVKRKCTL